MKKLALAAMIGGLVLAASSGSALAATTTSQEFTVVKVGTDPGTVVASGAITGVGSEDNNRLQVPRGAPFQVTFHFRQGDLFQTITPVGPPQIRFNPATCVTTTTIQDTTLVTGGTNGLAGTTGSGTATANLTSVAGRGNDGRCLGPGSPPIFELSVVRATGSLHLG
jgi:hypothetical protein